jgi:hypothetical protein
MSLDFRQNSAPSSDQALKEPRFVSGHGFSRAEMCTLPNPALAAVCAVQEEPLFVIAAAEAELSKCCYGTAEAVP